MFTSHYAAGEMNGVADALHGGDSTGFKGLAIHDDGIELDAAVAIQVRAKPRVKWRRVFELDDGGLDGVQRTAGGGENAPAGFQCAPTTFTTFGDDFGRDIPCTTVNDKGWNEGRSQGRDRSTALVIQAREPALGLSGALASGMGGRNAAENAEDNPAPEFSRVCFQV